MIIRLNEGSFRFRAECIGITFKEDMAVSILPCGNQFKQAPSMKPNFAPDMAVLPIQLPGTPASSHVYPLENEFAYLSLKGKS